MNEVLNQAKVTETDSRKLLLADVMFEESLVITVKNLGLFWDLLRTIINSRVIGKASYSKNLVRFDFIKR